MLDRPTRDPARFQSSAGEFDAHDFNFEAAEVGVVVFADAVGDIDEAALLEAELRGALGEVPADGADGCDGRGGNRL